ncbi:indolepyruvate ferredoxin oxidoreductase family protein [Cupriavidus consociatus]|uniref:indolepyruvate ferredoxin oxidoreductase family protein n=1 Tax=Cupriavidus consociatus TaxID=2821357 RepID=UPI001AE8758B|nr:MULTISPECIES: indolepyruvate ferredoxin oxidoreductase family protein [unclassified Cupriavidus]MBP0621153.1 indolepyruvate ferredoxin oxidoreductase family protein [Cupriavidus sp. LEh25]MDK2657823.1 indolepyruvate ferredoxin oxidoreductase family protein [Cupriavidus sp. LEh21]
MSEVTPPQGALLRPARLEDRYQLDRGPAYISGTQALVRLLFNQIARDRAAGLNTAGFVSGYRGSPLAGLDQALWGVQKLLKEKHIEFIPGVNEDLAATACWGTQQLMQNPDEATVDGVFAMWYGKGPGVDRSADALKHANAAGTSSHGGALVLAADDHTAKSSSFAHQSEQLLVASFIPILYPSNVQEYLDYGIHGWAMSRASGLWVGLKCVGDIVETTSIADIDPFRVECRPPEDFKASEDVHIRWPDVWATQEPRIVRSKLPLALSYCRANGLNRIVFKDAGSRVGIIAAGKPYNDVREALALLGIDENGLATKGIALLKLGMVWPLEPSIVREFAQGLDEIFVVEEKRALIEQQVKDILYPIAVGGDKAPRVVGKSGSDFRCSEFEIPDDQRLLRGDAELGPADIADAILARLRVYGVEACQTLLAKGDASNIVPPVARKPYFCSGCPHNSSTKVPEGSRATAGIGCHYMANWMNRRTGSYTHMGGEGVPWVGQSRFSKRSHIFANMGDGTFFHSGSLAIRQAVAAKTPMTFKILFNDAVALTGGQSHDGPLTAPMLTNLLHAEGVERVVVVSDDVAKYEGHQSAFAPGTTFHHRRDLDAIQRQLREVPGVTALVYDQTCAAEKRRRRKRNKYPDPAVRYVINPEVCEGCGDCTVKSNCVSIEPIDTPLGRKRQINQSSCNKDFSCADGFCPSFVAVEGGALRKKPRGSSPENDPLTWPEPPHPQLPELQRPYAVLVNGVGGTGVLTIGNILGMAAHLQGVHCSVMDMAGLAQKGGAVWSHVRIAKSGEDIHSPRIPDCAADAMIGGDLVVSAHSDSLSRLSAQCRAVVNANVSPTADFQQDRDFVMPESALWDAIEHSCAEKSLAKVPAQDLAVQFCGDSVYANMVMLGAAWQAGHVPLSLDALSRAIELNGQSVDANSRAFKLGRQYVASPDRFAKGTASVVRWVPRGGGESLQQLLEDRRNRLVGYQSASYANGYEAFLQMIQSFEGKKPDGYEQAVAKSLYKLMAYKDEYEVARLHASSDLSKLVESQFEGDFRVRFSLAPPLFARRGSDGLPRKKLYGSWVIQAFGVLSKLKVLRGTRLDPFGYTQERRAERALIDEYKLSIRATLPFVPVHPKKCLELARIPEQIRGFGHVKAAAIEEARKRQRALLREITGEDGLPGDRLESVAASPLSSKATS